MAENEQTAAAKANVSTQSGIASMISFFYSEGPRGSGHGHVAPCRRHQFVGACGNSSERSHIPRMLTARLSIARSLNRVRRHTGVLPQRR